MTPDDPFTELGQFAHQLHEMFLAMVEAGFTESQALYLMGCQLRKPTTPE